MAFKVTHVLDNNTFEVSPPWKWNDKGGIRVKAAGYKPPEEGEFGFRSIQDKLANMITGKEVELKNFKDIDYDCLVCDVILDGENVVDIFPES